MQLLIPQKVVKQLKRELKRAGSKEIGGLLLGEYVEEGYFRIVEITVQHSGGTNAEFLRQPGRHQTELDAFFARTGNDYSRFNYLGEWHSHPSFEAIPSARDICTMQSIVEDPSVGVNFLVLLIVKLSRWDIEVSATAFRPNHRAVSVQVSAEPHVKQEGESWFRWLLAGILWR